nr:immunoglobulin light chain junction region [Macaca mulatta]
CMQHKGLPWTF